MVNSFSDEDNAKKSKKQLKNKAAKVKELKNELQALLDKPLMMRGVSAKYITTRGRVGFVDQLVGGTGEPLLSQRVVGDGADGVCGAGHQSMLGIEASSALDDLPKAKKRPKGKKADK